MLIKITNQKRKNNKTQFITKLLRVVFAVQTLLFFTQCTHSDQIEARFNFRDLKTGEPIAGVEVWTKRVDVFAKIEKFFDFPYVRERYESRFSDKEGNVVWDRSAEVFGISTTHKFSHVCTLNGKSFTFNFSEADAHVFGGDRYSKCFIALEGGGLQADAEKLASLSRVDRGEAKAVLAKNKVSYYSYALRNDGNGIFSIKYRHFNVYAPDHVLHVTPTDLRWRIGEAPEPKKMLVTIRVKTPIRVTDVILEPNTDFTVAVSPLQSHEELKKIPYAGMYLDEGIENKYVLTVTPRSTEHVTWTNSLLLKTDPKLPDYYPEPYFGYIKMRVDNYEGISPKSKHPEAFFAFSPTLLHWKIGESPTPKKMVLSINAKNPTIKITDVLLEPNTDFSVEVSPLKSRSELKQIPSASLHFNDDIENNYVLTVTPRTTERAMETNSITLKTDPDIPGYREPRFDHVKMRVDDSEPVVLKK